MKLLGIAMFLTALLAAAFVIGLTGEMLVVGIVAFCGWTPVAWLTGYAIARSGLHISVGSEQYATPFIPETPRTSLVDRVNNQQRVKRAQQRMGDELA